MMNILVAQSIPRTLEVFVWASNKFREVTALRRKVRGAETATDPMVVVGISIVEEGSVPTFAILSRSQVEQVKNQQPLRDGIANLADMQRVARAQKAVMHQ